MKKTNISGKSNTTSTFDVENHLCDRLCRFCLEKDERKSALVSPCKCKGSQKYVHIHCLKRWQKTLLVERIRYAEAAYTCSVCKSKFSIEPPKISRLQEILFVPQSLVSRAYNWLTLPRTRTFPGLQAGNLLVASNFVSRNSAFYHSVVLVTEYSSFSGSRGVVVNSPSLNNTLSHQDFPDNLHVHVGYGGPVDPNLMSVLHNNPYLLNSVQICDGVFLAQSLAVVLACPLTIQVKALFGYVGWGPYQLDSEVINGGWHVLTAQEVFVFSSSRQSLWETLAGMIQI